MHPGVLFREGRHVGPMIIDMRNPVLGQHLKIAHTEEARVPDFHRIPKITRETQEKLIEP